MNIQENSNSINKKAIDTQFLEWSGIEVNPVAKDGHDNRTFHLGDKMAIRLPSDPDYVAQVEKSKMASVFGKVFVFADFKLDCNRKAVRRLSIYLDG